MSGFAPPALTISPLSTACGYTAGAYSERAGRMREHLPGPDQQPAFWRSEMTAAKPLYARRDSAQLAPFRSIGEIIATMPAHPIVREALKHGR